MKYNFFRNTHKMLFHSHYKWLIEQLYLIAYKHSLPQKDMKTAKNTFPSKSNTFDTVVAIHELVPYSKSHTVSKLGHK